AGTGRSHGPAKAAAASLGREASGAPPARGLANHERGGAGARGGGSATVAGKTAGALQPLVSRLGLRQMSASRGAGPSYERLTFGPAIGRRRRLRACFPTVWSGIAASPAAPADGIENNPGKAAI